MQRRVYQTASPKIVAWPSPQDYNEAVQNVASSFCDAKLKAGEAELSLIGLPKPISGAFASVYKISAGNKNYAVRCFLSNRQGQQLRYRKISQQLHSLHLECMVPFEYQDEGIRIHGHNYPLLIMEWVEGIHLEQFIQQNLNDSPLLDLLSAKWISLLNSLAESGIAHGDLQHGNILVSGDEFKLVDYDGMYVPSLKGDLSSEFGHRNYQHPLRSKIKFGPQLDNFSAWSIYASLYCLTRDAELWRMLHAGDECLLFRQEDYADPIASEAFLSLERHENNDVQNMSRLLRTILQLPYDEIPDLNNPPLISHDLPNVIGAAAKKAPQSKLNYGYAYQYSPNSNGLTEADKRWEEYQAAQRLSSPNKSGGLSSLTPFIVITLCLLLGLAYHLYGTFMDYLQVTSAHAVKTTEPVDPEANAYQSGLTSFQDGLYDEALASFNEAIKLNPSSENAVYSRAATYQMLKDYRSAISDYTKAIDMKPQDWRPYYNRGVCNWYYGYIDKAISDFEKSDSITAAKGYNYINRKQKRDIYRLRANRNIRPKQADLKVAL